MGVVARDDVGEGGSEIGRGYDSRPTPLPLSSSISNSGKMECKAI